MAQRPATRVPGLPRWLAWAGVGLATLLAALLGGCGDRRPLVLGFMGDLTGRTADLGVGGRDAVALAVEEVNAAGGLDGHPLQLLSVDDRQDADAAQRAYAALEKAGVLLAVGPMTSAVAADLQPQLRQGPLVMISPTVSSSAFDAQDDRLFRVVSSTRDYAQSSARFHAQRQGLKRVAVVLDLANIAFTQRWLDDFEAEFARHGGQVVGQVRYDLMAQPRFSQVVDTALGGQPDGLLILANAADTAQLVQQLRKRAPGLPVLSSEWSATDAFLTLGGQAVEGVHQSQFLDRQSGAPAYLDFVTRFRDRFGREPGFAEVAAYDAAQVALRALRERQGDEDIKQTLLRIRRFDGLQQPVEFNDTGDARRDTHMTVIRQGRYVVER